MPTQRTALIVDDDSSLRYVLARLARLEGFEILEANDGASALEAAEKKCPDIVIADVRLPNFDGFELCRRMKAGKATKSVPVILVTSMYYDSDTDDTDIRVGRRKAREAGALDLLLRGEALDVLRPMLKNHSGKKPPKKATTKRVAARKVASKKSR